MLKVKLPYLDNATITNQRKIFNLMKVTFRRMPGMTMFLLIFIFAIFSF
jgi:hypothetical protein